MAIYTILIHCSLLFIWVAKYCSGQNTGFNIQPFRTIHFVTANKTSDISIPYFNISVDTKTSLYFKIQTRCECSITLLQDGGRAVQIIIEDKEFDRSLKNGPIIHLSCHLFRNVNISIRWEPDGFILETVQLNGTTILRKTVINNTLGNAANQAIFSSAGKTEWTFYEADDRRSVQTTISDQPAKLCPISPHNTELPLHVSFLNGSSNCSEKMEVKTECETQNIIIKYSCNDRTAKCDNIQKILWIAACETDDTKCKSCKIMTHKFDINRRCRNDEAINMIYIKIDETQSDGRHCFLASTYLIIWHEIRDVFSQYQSSSQRPLTTTKAFPTTFSDKASYTTGMTTNYINQSTPTPSKVGSNKSIAGLVAGIVTGVGFIALIVVIFILRRFSLSCFARKVPDENEVDEQDYTGDQNVAYINSNASAIQKDNHYYATLGNETDGHNYGELKNSPQSEIECHTNEPHSYMTVYDFFDQNRQSAITNATYEEVKQKDNGPSKILGKTGDKHYDYAEFETNLTARDDSS